METYPDGSSARHMDKVKCRRVIWLLHIALNTQDDLLIWEAINSLGNDAEHGLIRRAFMTKEYAEISRVIREHYANAE